tara:strand:- start:14843 stop:15313 length:471 start_codon:yes stop_codon:yes gene_type:complete
MMLRLIVITVITLFFSACSSYGPSSNIFSRNDAGSSYDVNYGEILFIKKVKIDGNSSFIGTWGGAQIGRNVGQKVGERRTNPIAGTVGAIAGAVAGEALEKEVTSKSGIEITVKIDNGNTIAIVQPDEGIFKEGDRVRVLIGPKGQARVGEYIASN